MQNNELLEGEEFRPIEGAGKYLISNMGRIYNARYGKFMPVQENGHIWLYGSCYNVSELTELTHNEQ